MHLPVSSPKEGTSSWYFAIAGPVTCSVDFSEAGVVGVGTRNADGWESFMLVSSRCMSKDVWSPLIVPTPWMRILPKPSDTMDGHKINNSVEVSLF